MALCSCALRFGSSDWRTNLRTFVEHMEEVQIGWTKKRLRNYAKTPDRLVAKGKIWVYAAQEGGHVPMSSHGSQQSAVYRYFFAHDKLCRIERLVGSKTAKHYGWDTYHTESTEISPVIEEYNQAAVTFSRGNYQASLKHSNNVLARADFEKFPWIDSDRLGILMKLAESYSRTNKYYKSIKFFNTLKNDYPDHLRMTSLYKFVGDAYYMIGEKKESQRLWEVVKKQYPAFDIHERIERLEQQKKFKNR